MSSPLVFPVAPPAPSPVSPQWIEALRVLEAMNTAAAVDAEAANAQRIEALTLEVSRLRADVESGARSDFAAFSFLATLALAGIGAVWLGLLTLGFFQLRRAVRALTPPR